MTAPIGSSTQLFSVGNEDTADIDITSFGSPWTDVDFVKVETNAALNGVNEGISLENDPASDLQQMAGGHALANLDLTGQVIYTGHRAKIASNNGADWDDGGYGFGLRDGSGNFRAWKYGGFDDGYDNDTMRERIVDPSVVGNEVEDGGFDITDVDAIFWFATAEGSADHETIILQGFAIGPVTVTRGDTTTPATLDDFKTEVDNAGEYDLVFMTKIGGSLYRGVCPMVFGANDALEHRMVQSGFGLEFIQAVNDLWDSGAGERYGAILGDNTFGFTFEVSSNYYVDLSFATITSINPWHFQVNNNGNTSETLNFSSISFTKAGDVDLNSPAVFAGCSFDDCGQMVIAGAILTDCTIKNPTDGTACTITTSSDIDGTAFETDTGADYAIEIAVAGTYDLTEVTYTGFTKDIDVTATTGTVTINITDGDTPTYDTAGATVVINSGVTVEITVLDSDSVAIEDARVYLRKSGGGAEILNSLTNASGVATTTFTDSVPQTVEGWIRKATTGTLYRQFNLGGSITTTGYITTALMQEDE